MITTLLTELDGVSANSTSRVILVAATNRKGFYDDLDSSILRMIEASSDLILET